LLEAQGVLELRQPSLQLLLLLAALSAASTSRAFPEHLSPKLAILRAQGTELRNGPTPLEAFGESTPLGSFVFEFL
jgi:hypothetical protein